MSVCASALVPEPDSQARPSLPLDLGLARAEWARRRLLRFCVLTFPGYAVGRHHQALAERLEAIDRGELTRLIVELPPRHGKSELVSVRFPAWYLGRHPGRHIIAASYGGELAHTFSRQARNLLRDPLWPFSACRLADDASGVEHWATTAGGGLVAAGVGGAITGFGANLLVIDDPVRNREDADSPTLRDAAWEWYTSTARTRLQPGAAVVVCQTRWHEDDLAGRLLAAQSQGGEQWELLRLPAIAEVGDPLHRAVGEPLWPEWYDAAALDTIRRTVGSRNWSALYQQRPMPAEGAMFQRAWFTTVPSAPPGLRWVRYWDLAASTSAAGDYTVGAKVAFASDGTMYVGDIARGRWEWPDALAVVSGIARMDGPSVVVGIEGIGVQRGFRQTLQRDPSLRGIALVDVPVLKDKALRAASWQARAEAGKVALVLGPWNAAFLDEVTTFPLGEHDDQIDAVSGTVQMLATAGSIGTVRVSMR